MNTLEDYRYLNENGEPCIRYVDELKYWYNRLGGEEVSKILGTSLYRIEIIRISKIPGSTRLDKLLEANESDFVKYKDELVEKVLKEQRKKEEKETKAWILSGIIYEKRESFAKKGTNKAKRRLSKLAKTDPIAQAVRFALDIEDKNIAAMDAPCPHSLDMYMDIDGLIQKLKELFVRQGWCHGTHPSDDSEFDVFYFDIPDCERISWRSEKIDEYGKEWDVVDNCNLDKLDKIAEKLLVNYKVGKEKKTVQPEAGEEAS